MAHAWKVRGASFFNLGLLRDANFVVGLVYVFIVGMILHSNMALLPATLQGLLDYPALHTGEIMAARGIGTMLSMFAMGRLMMLVDARTLVAFGFALLALSLYQMTRLTLDMDSRLLIVSGFVQGEGIGFFSCR